MNRESREQHYVERVSVLPQRLRCESIVKRVCRGSVVGAIKFNHAGILIYLIFIMRAFRYFNNYINLVRGIIAQGYIVPEVHIFILY